MAEKTEAQRRAQKAYMEKFVRVEIRMDAEQRAAIQAHATAHRESVNGFINRAIGEAMERDSAGCPTAAPTGGDGILTRSTINAAQEAAQAAGEGLSQFVARAVEMQAQRDALARKMEGNQ